MALAEGLVRNEDGVTRCWWGGGTDELYRAYHDDEWGVPVVDDVRLFEKLSLEGFQAGLSWITILRKREAFRRAFAGFDLHRVAAFGYHDVDHLLEEAPIVRHRGQIVSEIENAGRARCGTLVPQSVIVDRKPWVLATPLPAIAWTISSGR